MKTIKDLFFKHKEILMYLIIGGLTTVVNWIVYAVCTQAITFSTDTVNIFLANVIAWIISVAFAYITNKLFVFESYSWKPIFVIRELALFVSARLATGLIEILGVPFLVGLGLNQTLFGIEGMLCKLVVSVLVVILNYVFSKLFIFKKDTATK